MSLFIHYNDPRLLRIAQNVFSEQFLRDPKLSSELDDRRKQLMYDDILYNLSYLFTAIHFEDVKIFEHYAVWLYELLCNLMKDFDRDRIMEQMNGHYRVMADLLLEQGTDLLNTREMDLAQVYLRAAMRVTENAVTRVPLSEFFLEGPFGELRKSYLDALLQGNTQHAHEIIKEAFQNGRTIKEIYEDVLAKVLHEIGVLWHGNIITVDKEHYATSVTQAVLSQFYDQIFSRPKHGRVLLSFAIGSELHEVGIRMLSDLFEYHGWDTRYLGAALPTNAVLQAIDQYKPDLIAMSVTMTPYLHICETLIDEIKAKHPHIKIAVGGQAFLSTEALWKKWSVDFYAPTAQELLQQIKSVFPSGELYG